MMLWGVIAAIFAWLAVCVIVGSVLIVAFGIFSKLCLKPVDEPLSDYAHGDIPRLPSSDVPVFHSRGVKR